MMTCPSCGSKRPIDVMTIDKMLRATQEESLSTAPDETPWQVRCEECDPKRIGYYWFSLDQCDTPAKALNCIMQLNDHTWAAVTLQSFIKLIEQLFGRGALTDD
jgi:hypothetical protein